MLVATILSCNNTKADDLPITLTGVNLKPLKSKNSKEITIYLARELLTISLLAIKQKKLF